MPSTTRKRTSTPPQEWEITSSTNPSTTRKRISTPPQEWKIKSSTKERISNQARSSLLFAPRWRRRRSSPPSTPLEEEALEEEEENTASSTARVEDNEFYQSLNEEEENTTSSTARVGDKGFCGRDSAATQARTEVFITSSRTGFAKGTRIHSRRRSTLGRLHYGSARAPQNR